MTAADAHPRLVQWTGIDDPERLDAASVTLAADSLTARGTSRTAEYVTAWSLETGPGWVTRRVSVSVFGAAWSRRLELTRNDAGRWTSSSESHGESGLPPALAGIEDQDALDDALDCDIGLCPVTNTMPILRLDLLRGSVAETHLVMAWIEIPSLRVIRSDQIYASHEPFDPAAGHGVVTYRSMSRDFVGRLTIDRDGLVIDYPSLATRA